MSDTRKGTDMDSKAEQIDMGDVLRAMAGAGHHLARGVAEEVDCMGEALRRGYLALRAAVNGAAVARARLEQVLRHVEAGHAHVDGPELEAVRAAVADLEPLREDSGHLRLPLSEALGLFGVADTLQPLRTDKLEAADMLEQIAGPSDRFHVGERLPDGWAAEEGERTPPGPEQAPIVVPLEELRALSTLHRGRRVEAPDVARVLRKVRMRWRSVAGLAKALGMDRRKAEGALEWLRARELVATRAAKGARNSAFRWKATAAGVELLPHVIRVARELRTGQAPLPLERQAPATLEEAVLEDVMRQAAEAEDRAATFGTDCPPVAVPLSVALGVSVVDGDKLLEELHATVRGDLERGPLFYERKLRPLAELSPVHALGFKIRIDPTLPQDMARIAEANGSHALIHGLGEVLERAARDSSGLAVHSAPGPCQVDTFTPADPCAGPDPFCGGCAGRVPSLERWLGPDGRTGHRACVAPLSVDPLSCSGEDLSRMVLSGAASLVAKALEPVPPEPHAVTAEGDCASWCGPCRREHWERKARAKEAGGPLDVLEQEERAEAAATAGAMDLPLQGAE